MESKDVGEIEKIVDDIQPEKEVKKTVEKKRVDYKKGAVLIGIIALSIFLIFGANIDEFQPIKDYVFGTPSAPVPSVASLNISRFSDLKDNDTLNVEMWVKNDGDVPADSITIYIRCRNQNGTILFSNHINLTSDELTCGQEASGTYSFLLDNSTKVMHTIEMTWASGRTLFLRETSLN